MRQNLSTEMESPWSIEDPSFIKSKSLATTCWWGLLMYSVYQEEPQTELLASCAMPSLFMSSEPTTSWKPWLHPPNNRLRSASSNQKTEAYITEGHTVVGGKADVCPTPGSFKDSCSLFLWGPLLSLTLTLNLRILMEKNSEDSNRIPPIPCPQSPQYEWRSPSFIQ